MWDAVSVIGLLRRIGFEARECTFREGTRQDVAMLDLEARRDESFYVEAIKLVGGEEGT